MTKKLFTPGPMNVPQKIRVQLSKEIIHHRMNDFHIHFNQVRQKLKTVFETEQEVILLTSSGTGAMESAVVNLFSEGDRVLVINTGFFGERFIQICQLYRLKVIRLDYPWGDTFQIEDVKKTLAYHQDIKGVFVTYHETSTGVLNPIKELGKLVAQTDAILVTDCISGMIVHPFKFDDWKIDCAVTSSQKGFGLPPGLSMVALSKKGKERLGRSTLPKYYFDYNKYLVYANKGESPFTPAISLVVALNVALDDILERGIDSIVEEKVKLRRYTEKKFQELGFELFIKDESIRGNVIVPVIPRTEWRLNLTECTRYLDERYNLQVSKGQGEYTENMLRIGILSDFTTEDIDTLVVGIQDYILNTS